MSPPAAPCGGNENRSWTNKWYRCLLGPANPCHGFQASSTPGSSHPQEAHHLHSPSPPSLSLSPPYFAPEIPPPADPQTQYGLTSVIVPAKLRATVLSVCCAIHCPRAFSSSELGAAHLSFVKGKGFFGPRTRVRFWGRTDGGQGEEQNLGCRREGR